MPTTSGLYGAWSHNGPAGTTQAITLTWLDEEGEPLDLSGGVSIWLDDSDRPVLVRDTDDLTEATEYEATSIDDNVAVVAIPIPAGSSAVWMRTTVDGVVKTIGKLRPHRAGGTSTDDVVVRSESVSVTVSTLGTVVIEEGGGGTAATTTFTPAGTVAATNVQTAIEEVSGDVTVLTALVATDAEVAAALAGLAALYQGLDADLSELAGLSPANDDFVQQKAGVWVNRTPAQVAADLYDEASFADTYLTQADAGDTYVASDDVREIVKLTQAAYDALTPDAETLYVVTDPDEVAGYKTATTSVTASAAVAVDAELTVNLTPGRWIITGLLIADGAAAGDIRLAWTSTASDMTGSVNFAGQSTSASGFAGSYNQSIVAKDAESTRGLNGAGNDFAITVAGGVRCITAGTFSIAWAQAVSDATATRVKLHSWIRAKRAVA